MPQQVKTLKGLRKQERYKQLRDVGLDVIYLRRSKAQLDVFITVALNRLAKLEAVNIQTAYNRLKAEEQRVLTHMCVVTADKGELIRCVEGRKVNE